MSHQSYTAHRERAGKWDRKSSTYTHTLRCFCFCNGERGRESVPRGGTSTFCKSGVRKKMVKLFFASSPSFVAATRRRGDKCYKSKRREREGGIGSAHVPKPRTATKRKAPSSSSLLPFIRRPEKKGGRKHMHAHKLPLGPRFSSSSSDFECVAGGGGERKGGNTFLQGTWLSRSYAHVQRKREGGRIYHHFLRPISSVHGRRQRRPVQSEAAT